MSDKYIIRNCPSIYQNFEDKFVCTTQIKQKGFPCYCQDCTDCVMKQIVELCGKYHIIDAGYQKVAINYLSSDILKLLDIQEVE